MHTSNGYHLAARVHAGHEKNVKMCQQHLLRVTRNARLFSYHALKLSASRPNEVFLLSAIHVRSICHGARFHRHQLHYHRIKRFFVARV